MNYTAERAPSPDERIANSKAAKMRGVSTRTLDRWIAAGLIPKPEKINGRKYHRVGDILAPLPERA
jgi:predicted site-specific integrase-resolvase